MKKMKLRIFYRNGFIHIVEKEKDGNMTDYPDSEFQEAVQDEIARRNKQMRMDVLMAVLYQGGQWDEIVVDVPDICTCMTYDEINEKARSYFHSAPEYKEYDECFGAYVTDERYDEEHVCVCKELAE